MVANVREKLAVAKQELLKFYAGRFNLRKVNELEVRKQFRINVLTRFTALENLSDIEDMSRAWKNINPLNTELNPICCLLALLGAHHFLHVSRISVKSLTLRLLMSYIYGAPILDVSRSHKKCKNNFIRFYLTQYCNT
jgi:hypothetical protein